MTTKGILIADSGGTSTSWIHSLDEQWSFEMESIHPRRIQEFSIERKAELKIIFSKIDYSEVHFYGSGCSSELAKEQVSEFLSSLGLNNCTINTDSLLACRALLGNNAGYVAILGTGSVLMEYNGIEITKSIGGFGPIIGDEGGGMAFGKLFLKYYLTDQAIFDERLQNIIGSKSEVLAKLSQADSLKYISNLGNELAPFDLKLIHAQNIFDFLEQYLPIVKGDKIHFIGSYAFSQQEILKKCLKEKEWELGTVYSSPLTSVRRTYYAAFIE
jgi:glucosamine kinase